MYIPFCVELSQDLQTVLLGFLQPDPTIRLTADQALTLPAIKRVLRYKSVKDCCRNYVSAYILHCLIAPLLYHEMVQSCQGLFMRFFKWLVFVTQSDP